MRQRMLRQWTNPEYRGKMRQAALSHEVSPGTREKLRQGMLSRKNALDRKHSPETRERMCQAALARWHNPEYREKQRRASLGNKNSLGRKLSPEHRERLRQARLRRTLPQKMTSIECLLHDEFKKRRLKFEMHKTMLGRFQPDFVFEDAWLIVQADGDYWHSLPDRIESDHAFNAAASSEGWSVWRFGEREIKMHAPACARAVARFARDRLKEGG